MNVPPRRALLATLPGVVALLGVALLTATVVAQSATPTASCPPGLPTMPPSPWPAEDAPDLTVFAAASLTDAFEDLREPWSAAYPGSELILAFDASSALRAQIEQGAPADVFASADVRNARTLVDACLAIPPLSIFTGNALALVTPVDDPAGITSPADLARPGVRVVTAAPEVPISRYTGQVIQRLAILPGYPPDYVAAVAANTVSEEDNVRSVLAKVELGEADAALVYATDARSSEAVATVDIPRTANVAAAYAAVAVAGSDDAGLAAAFLDFLAQPAAQAVLAEHGFVPPPAEPT